MKCTTEFSGHECISHQHFIIPLKTKDGFEIHFGVNHLGHFLLANLLLDCVKRAAPSRIVVVSSLVHNKGEIDFGDLMMEQRTVTLNFYFGNQLYFNSKPANALFSDELARRLRATDVNVYCLCPGLVRTNIAKLGWFEHILATILFSLFVKTARQGCQTTLYCALSQSCRYESGEMYQHCRKWLPEDRIPLSPKVAAKLWTVSEKLVGISN